MDTYASYGLTTQQVNDRISQGQVNVTSDATSRSLASIIRANVFTIFNAILLSAMLVVLILGTWKDAVFGFVMIANALIGIASEWRAKRTLDALAIVDAPTARVWRNGQSSAIPIRDVVLDDAIELLLGDRIGVDGEVIDSVGLEVDESLLTGESVPVRKNPGDTVLAGTHVVSGSALIIATAVGEEVYAQGITRQVKKFTRTASEIQQGIDVILRWISFLIIPVVVMMTWTQWRASGADGSADWRFAMVLAVAGIVGMIPQGLVLLTSMNFALGSAKLARQGILVQELPAVEVLARVDCLNLDKTGTLTTGGIRFHSIDTLCHQDDELREHWPALAALNSSQANPTAKAIIQGLTATHGMPRIEKEHHTWDIPFNSQRKWSACGYNNRSWYLGAPEILMDAMAGDTSELQQKVSRHAQAGQRVILLASSATQPPLDEASLPIPVLPVDLTAGCLIVLEEELRADARDTLNYFREQGVRVRIISGDNPVTVGALAQKLHLQGTEPSSSLRVIDARTLPKDMDSPEFIQAIRDNDVFGRVTPEQKRAMVRAQQADGHTVAMTGDGVNDALALKDADLGIAMGNGAPATKAVAQLVLVNGEFSVLPGVVAEGRRIIANMERVSSLFLTKTMYSLVCIIICSVMLWPYPFLPRHLTYIGDLTIGIPAFFIALGPNTRRYIPGFLSRTLRLAVPAGTIAALTALAAYWTSGIGNPLSSTVATLTLTLTALWLTAITGRPLFNWRGILIAGLAALSILGVLIPQVREFFALMWPDSTHWAIIASFGAAGIALIEGAYRYIYQPVAHINTTQRTQHA